MMNTHVAYMTAERTANVLSTLGSLRAYNEPHKMGNLLDDILGVGKSVVRSGGKRLDEAAEQVRQKRIAEDRERGRAVLEAQGETVAPPASTPVAKPASQSQSPAPQSTAATESQAKNSPGEPKPKRSRKHIGIGAGVVGGVAALGGAGYLAARHGGRQAARQRGQRALRRGLLAGTGGATALGGTAYLARRRGQEKKAFPGQSILGGIVGWLGRRSKNLAKDPDWRKATANVLFRDAVGGGDPVRGARRIETAKRVLPYAAAAPAVAAAGYGAYRGGRFVARRVSERAARRASRRAWQKGIGGGAAGVAALGGTGYIASRTGTPKNKKRSRTAANRRSKG